MNAETVFTINNNKVHESYEFVSTATKITRNTMTNDTSGYDPIRETYHAGFDWPGTRPPSVALVEAMAAVTDVDPAHLDSLYESINPDAMDDLFAHRPFDSTGFDGSVTFTFCDHEVSIHASGEIVIDLSES